MKDVYVISKGDYSDYSVLCACPTKKDADVIAKRMNEDDDVWGGPVRVERLPVHTADVEKVAILRMRVNIWDDGTTTLESASVSHEWPFDTVFDDPMPMKWRWVRAPVHGGRGGRLEVSGTDHERVRRVFSDRRAMLLTDDAMRAKREMRGRVSRREEPA